MITPGRTQDFFFFKAGTARVYILDAILAATYSVSSTITGDLSSTGLTFDVVSATGFAKGNFVQIDDEIMYVSDVTGTTLTVVRGRDSSAAEAHSAGAKVCKVAEGISLDTAITSPVSEVLDYDGTQLAVGDLLRAERQHGGNERLLVHTAGTAGSVDGAATRDLNLDKNLFATAYTYTTSQYLIKVNSEIRHPFALTNLEQYWKEIETKGGIRIAEERTTIETMGDQRGRGDTFTDFINWTVTFISPLTSPLFLKMFDPVNYAGSSNGLVRGRPLNYKTGSQIKGVQVAIIGQEEKQTEKFWIYDAQLTTKGETAFNNAHRECEISLFGVKSQAFGAFGVHAEPLACS